MGELSNEFKVAAAAAVKKIGEKHRISRDIIESINVEVYEDTSYNTLCDKIEEEALQVFTNTLEDRVLEEMDPEWDSYIRSHETDVFQFIDDLFDIDVDRRDTESVLRNHYIVEGVDGNVKYSEESPTEQEFREYREAQGF